MLTTPTQARLESERACALLLIEYLIDERCKFLRRGSNRGRIAKREQGAGRETLTLKEREREKEERNKRVTGKLHTLKGERELDNGKNHGYGKREKGEL